ncbi:ATP-binding protein [Paenibacillus chibensis]
MMRSTNNNSLKYIAIMAFFLGTLLCLRWVWSGIFYTEDHPRAVGGVIDLRGIDLDASASFYLDGEWEFYPGFLDSSASIRNKPAASRFIQVPGDWKSALNKDSDSAYGYGTYRLRILIDPLLQPAELWFQQIDASSQIVINGNAEHSMGKPASAANAYSPKNVSYTATLSQAGTREIELLVHVANFDNPYAGGIISSIRFGSQASIDYVRWYSIGFQMATFLILLLHGLYACILFIFNRQEHALLWTFFLMLTTGIAIVAGHDNVLLLWLPINYTWGLKIRLLALLWQNLFILMIFRKFASAPQENRWLRIYASALSGLSIVLIFAPASWVHGMIHYHVFIIFYVLAFAWFVYVAGTMIIKKQADKDIGFLLLSGAGITSNIVWSRLEGSLNVTTVYYPIDIIVAIIGFSTYWFKKYFRHAQENTQLNKQLQEANKLKDQFLANTSHELRTPLHGIMNIAQTVVTREKRSMDAGSVKDMELLITISRRMSHMLGDLLDAARLREHRIILQQEPLLIQSVIPGVIAMLKYMTEGKPVRLSMEISDTMPPVMADEKRLVQIVYNLLHNALKFTEEGIIAVSAEMREGRIVIQVSDTGVGMDEETRAKVFLPYEQGSYGIYDGRGIGLGLSICQQLVSLHGGTLTVDSKPGKGSVFRFDLPAAGIQSSSSSEDHAPVRPLLEDSIDQIAGVVMPDTHNHQSAAAIEVPPLLFDGSPKILAVDDDPVNLNVLTGILSTESYNITTTNSAMEALERLGTQHWDLIIADVMMPHMSGYELTQKIRERYSLSELPVLLLTARSQIVDTYTGFAAGANDYVTKPVDALELKYRIRALVTTKRSINERLRMEAAYLQAQIHPHFLFNTLNSLMALSDIDTKRMKNLGEAFASYLRISFDYMNTGELVHLSHELELVQAYLFIEKERFGDRLSVGWEVESRLNPLLPPLSIQPLIENAVKHGLLSRERGGTVLLRIAREPGGFVRVEVKDNGVGIDPDTVVQLLSPSMKGKKGIGLANTHRRLTQLYGRGLSITSNPREGTTVSFIIPDM